MRSPIDATSWRIAIENRPLAFEWMRRYRIPSRLYDDAEQVCVEAMAVAASRWDKAKGAFSTIASFYIRGALTDLVNAEIGHDTMCSKDKRQRKRREPMRRIKIDDSIKVAVDEHPDFYALAWLRGEILDLPEVQRAVMLRLHVQGADRNTVAAERGISRQAVSLAEDKAIQRLTMARRPR